MVQHAFCNSFWDFIRQRSERFACLWLVFFHLYILLKVLLDFFFQWKVLSNYCLRVFNEPLSWVDVFNEPCHVVEPDSPCLKAWRSKTSVSCGLFDGSLAESTKTENLWTQQFHLWIILLKFISCSPSPQDAKADDCCKLRAPDLYMYCELKSMTFWEGQNEGGELSASRLMEKETWMRGSSDVSGRKTVHITGKWWAYSTKPTECASPAVALLETMASVSWAISVSTVPL